MLGDYMIWKMTFGSIVDLRADGNRNGVVDGGDYNVWRDHLDQYSAWYTGPSPGGGGSGSIPVVIFGQAPQVANVTLSGSNSTHAPYSFDDHDGNGEQLRTVAVGGVDTISITFAEDVNIVASDLRLTGLRSADSPQLLDFSYDVATMTASWRVETITKGDHYLISLSDAVTDVEGNPLDGEWVNPASLSTTNSLVSEFPSGDGTAGGDFNFLVSILPGDATLDLVVDMYDYYIRWGSNNGQWNSGGAQYTNADINGDGIVDNADISLMMQNFGVSLQNVWMLADLNGDFVVDDADANILFTNWSNGVQNPTRTQGDLNGDHLIDVHDLDLMFAQYGLEFDIAS